MKLMSLMMVSLSVLTAANTAFAASSEYKCINVGYRDDAFEVGKYEVTLQETNPEGVEPLIELAEKNLSLGDRLSVRSVSLVLDRSEPCSTPMPYLVKCSAEEATGYVLVNGYVMSKDNVSAKITIGLRATLKNLLLQSKLSARGPVAVGKEVTVDLDQLGVSAQALVEINGLQVPAKWKAHFETKNPDAGFTDCKPLKENAHLKKKKPFWIPRRLFCIQNLNLKLSC